MTAAARITAGYDEGPLDHCFPAADAVCVAHFDAGRLCEPLAAAVGALCGASASITLSRAPAASAGFDWRSRDDGLAVGCGGGLALADAMLSRDCGGGFVAGVAPLASASLARRRATLAAALCEAVGGLWPDGQADWSGCPAPIGVLGWRFAVVVAGVDDFIDLAVVVPPCKAATHDEWHGRLYAQLTALAIPVRVVLHEGPIAVRAARALRVGDVLPLATANEVGIRAGRSCVARGRIAAASEDAPRIEIVRRGSR